MPNTMVEANFSTPACGDSGVAIQRLGGAKEVPHEMSEKFTLRLEFIDFGSTLTFKCLISNTHAPRGMLLARIRSDRRRLQEPATIKGKMAAMNDDKHDALVPAAEPQAPGHSPAEQKRREARRLFLRGTVAGSGMVIATMYHQRASAQAQILASSPEACFSLTGNRSTTTTEITSMGRSKTVYVCTPVRGFRQ